MTEVLLLRHCLVLDEINKTKDFGFIFSFDIPLLKTFVSHSYMTLTVCAIHNIHDLEIMDRTKQRAILLALDGSICHQST